MRKLCRCSIVLTLALLSLDARAAMGQAAPSAALVSWIEGQMQRYGFPGAGVAVIRDYRIEWARGFGLSDKENRTEVTERTLFQAASVSKAVTAVAALIAAEEKRLNIDEDINTVFRTARPEPSVGPWRLAGGDDPNTPVSLRLLLSHTAGTSDFRYSGYRYGYYDTPPRPIDPLPSLREELTGLPPANTPAIKVERQPGVHWRYSPAGYTVIQAALMDLYGADFAAVMRRLVLAPLGMDDSTFAQPVPEALMARMAVPYLPDGQRLPDGPRVFVASAAGGLTTTPTDLAKFVIALQKALRGQTQGAIAPHLAEAMMTRQPGRVLGECFPADDPGEKACRTSWGLGLDVNLTRYFEHRPDGAPTGDYFGHTGFNSGYLALVMGSKTDGNGIAILANMAPEDMSGSVPQFPFLTDLVRRVADEEGWK